MYYLKPAAAKTLLGLIAFCLLPCLFAGRAGAQGTAPSGVSGNILWLHADSITGVANGAAVSSPLDRNRRVTAEGDK